MINIKEAIELKYGSINKFCELIDKTVISKQTIYKLMVNPKPNPTLRTMVALAKYLGLELIDVVNTYKELSEGVQHEQTY